MAIGSSDMVAQEVTKQRNERKDKWCAHFLALGIESTRRYVSAHSATWWKICSRLGLCTKLLGATEALTLLSAKKSGE